jgi:hypothetical protein
MHLRFTIIALLIAFGFIIAAETSLETELQVTESLLEQAEKQSKDRATKDKIKNARKEMEFLARRAHTGTAGNIVLNLLSFQKRLRSFPQQEVLQKTYQQISKILVMQKAFHADRRKEFGMNVLELTAPEGRFSFYFPDDVIENDSFTYSIQLQPFGLTDADRAENQKTLSNYRVEFGSRPLSITTTLQQLSVGSSPATADAVMKTSEGFETVRSTWTFSRQSGASDASNKSAQTSGDLELDTHEPVDPVIDVDIPHLLYQLPSINQAGRFLEIRGPFDGIAENTHLSINKNGAYIIAESPRKMIAFNPRFTGRQEIRLVEQEKRVRCVYRNLDLRSWASVETLARGASAAFTIQLDAATDVRSPLIIAVENKTPDIISIENGTFQYITVDPKNLSDTGSVTLSRTLTGMHPAPFRIDARLDTTYLFANCVQPD